MQQGDTISAIATASGESGIGIIRISGEGAIETAERIFRAQSGRQLREARSYQALFGQIVRDDGAMVDEAICLVMRTPILYEGGCGGAAVPWRQNAAQRDAGPYLCAWGEAG